MTESDLREAYVEAELQAEFPELRLLYAEVTARSRRSPQPVRERLREMSNRYTGPKAVQLRQEPIPWAYRVFFRQVGIDPDDRRTPAEALALERMRAGAFKPRNLLDDAITIATVETGVPVIAFDADQVSRGLELRLSREGELLGSAGRPLSASQIVVADDERALGVLFADMDPDRGVQRDTERMLICAVQVAGVPDIAVEEAIWTVEEILTFDD